MLGQNAAMARVLVALAIGGPEQLDIVEQEATALGPGRVRIAVRAAAVNPADVKRLAGEFGRSDPPFRLGSEASGVVVGAAPGSEGPAGPINAGDEVVAFRVSGAMASEIVVPATAVLPKPAPLSFEEAAGLLLTGATAFHLLEATGVGTGDRVLVHGASGSVGAAVLQLLRERGAAAVGTASERSAEAVSRYGATPVAYGPGLADRVRAVWPQGPTAALDCVGTDEALDVSVELVADRGRIATIAGFAHGAELGVKLLGGGPGADPGTELRDAARLELVRLAEAGRLTVTVGRVLPLEHAREAFELVASGHPGGKVVLVP